MATTDVSSVTIALPTIARELDVDLPQAQWVALGYMLGTASLMLFFGRLSDLIGRRRLALVGFAVYGGFAIVSALSVNLPMLVKLATCRRDKTPAEAVADAEEAGRKYIQIASKLLAEAPG
jgi:MFS family permease